MNAEDSAFYRATILDWPVTRVEAYIKEIQDRRMARRLEMIHAEKLAKQIVDERNRDRAVKALELMTKDFTAIDKKLNKITDRWSFIRMLAMEQGIDIYKEAPADVDKSTG